MSARVKPASTQSHLTLVTPPPSERPRRSWRASRPAKGMTTEQYVRYLEARQRELNFQIGIYVAAIVMFALALLAISTLKGWS